MGSALLVPPTARVLVSDIVTFSVEHRLFVLDAQAHATSRYLTRGHLDVLGLEYDPERKTVLNLAAKLLSD